MGGDMSDTPRTDALVQIADYNIEIYDHVLMLNHARALERECAALQEEVGVLREQYKAACEAIDARGDYIETLLKQHTVGEDTKP